METVIYFIAIGLLFYFMIKGCCGGGHKHKDSENEGHGETKPEEKKKGCC